MGGGAEVVVESLLLLTGAAVGCLVVLTTTTIGLEFGSGGVLLLTGWREGNSCGALTGLVLDGGLIVVGTTPMIGDDVGLSSSVSVHS